MIKKCFRPFWSYDVIETEKWLGDMAGQGWRLVAVDFVTRMFRFEKGAPSRVVYRIQYEKAFDGSLPEGLRKAGWEITLHTRHWCFYINSDSDSVIKAEPTYASLAKRNESNVVAHSVILGIYTFVLLMLLSVILPTITFTIVLCLFSDQLHDAVLNIVNRYLIHGFTPYLFAALIVLAAITFFSSLYSFILLLMTNKQLKLQNRVYDNRGSSQQNYPRVASNLNILHRQGRLVAKHRNSRFFPPDKIEEWLEKMASQGMILYHIEGGTYYFIKGEPVKVKFVMDYQTDPQSEYYDINVNAGWLLYYCPIQARYKWFLWGKIYHEDDEPQFYSDKVEALRHIKSFSTKSSAFQFLPVILYSGIVLFSIFSLLRTSINFSNNFSDSEVMRLTFISIMMFLITIIGILMIALIGLYIYFALQPVFYFFRMKKKLGNS